MQDSLLISNPQFNQKSGNSHKFQKLGYVSIFLGIQFIHLTTLINVKYLLLIMATFYILPSDANHSSKLFHTLEF